jgi:hypothetical protein
MSGVGQTGADVDRNHYALNTYRTAMTSTPIVAGVLVAATAAAMMRTHRYQPRALAAALPVFQKSLFKVEVR